MESGEWRVESGEWGVESGEWRVESMKKPDKLEFNELFQISNQAVIPSKRSASRDLFGSKSEVPSLKAKRSFDFAAKWLLRSG